jgi:hypothetical protein
MIRCALLIWVTLVVATCFGCALAPSPVPLSPIACAAITNVGVVPTSFDPTSATGTPPASGPAPANIQADLLAAYNAAPAYFQTQLCGLDGIFVTAGSQSWGYRNINDGRRYIAISMSLWSPSGPITLDHYQNRVFGPPLSWRSSTDPSPPTYLPATPNDGTMTVLAALAHEFGHVFWSDTLVFPRGTNPHSSRFCALPHARAVTFLRHSEIQACAFYSVTTRRFVRWPSGTNRHVGTRAWKPRRIFSKRPRNVGGCPT